jgi:two-component system nitrate/nitrite response regulator NarL
MRILVVDDHSAVRKGIRLTLATCAGLDVIGEGTNGEEAINQTDTLHPDLVIMDVSMPVMDGLNAAAIIKSYHPEVHILMFSMHKIREFIETARKLGLDGYVPKEDDGPCLRTAVQAVLDHQTYFPELN